MTAEPLTPLMIEAKLRGLVGALDRAQATLADARDAEVDARHDYERAKRRAILSEKAPRVERGGYTVAYLTAWCEEQCADLKLAADKAAVVTEAAKDRLRTLMVQAEICRSLSASVRHSFDLAGVSG